jgi:uncharacterized protein (TIGR02466 family)
VAGTRKLIPRSPGARRGRPEHLDSWAVRRMVEATAGPGSFLGALFTTAWTTICRAGAYHAPHSHPDSAWSGVYYLDGGALSPDRPLSGVLEFLDPRAGVQAVTAPGDPYGELVRVLPEAGLLVIFPSWLYHWVHPYASHTPRIAVSFNVAVHNAPGDEIQIPFLKGTNHVVTCIR